MKKKVKLFMTILTLCFAFAVMSLGVYSMLTVTYTTMGTVSYEIDDAFVEFETRVYITSKRFESNKELEETSVELAGYTFDELNSQSKLDETNDFQKVQIKNVDEPTDFAENEEYYVDKYSSVTSDRPPEPLVLNLKYSSSAKEFTYFVITKVTNQSTIPLYAYVTFAGEDKYVAPENSYTYKISEYKFLETLGSTQYIVFAMSLKDITVPIDNSFFRYPVSVTMDLPENVTFTAEESVVNINSLTLKGAENNEYSSIDMNNAESLDLRDITVPANSSIELVLDVNSTDIENYQKFILSYQNGIPQELEINSSSLILPQSNEERTYTITITNTSSSDLKLDYIQFNIKVESMESLLQTDETFGYQYVEMGTIPTETGNEYVRWRYISTDGQTKATGTQTSLNGYYVLETDVQSVLLNKLLKLSDNEITQYIKNGNTLGLMAHFNSNYAINSQDSKFYQTAQGLTGVYASDYKTSLIRKYLNYTTATVSKMGSQSEASNLVADLNIDINTDEIYKLITARTIQDLYQDISLDNTTLSVPNVEVEGLNDTTGDKFWLLSYTEVLNLICGGTWDNTLADWNVGNNTSYYWLRTAYVEATFGVCSVHSDGSFGFNILNQNFVGIRAGFKIGE